MKSRLFRSLRGIYGRILPRSKPNVDVNENVFQSKRIKMDVKMKVGKKYERRALLIKRNGEATGKQEWTLDVVKNADYTSFDRFRLSENFITQIYDSKSSKCSIVLVEETIRLKLKSLSDKWRLVEFFRANLESKALKLSGTLLLSPKNVSKHLPVSVYFKDTTLVILDRISQNILVHQSLHNFETFSCKQKQKQVSFEWKHQRNTSEVWAIRTDVAVEIVELINSRLVPKHTPIPPPPRFVPIPPQPYTDV